jgi:hypothetical protein
MVLEKLQPCQYSQVRHLTVPGIYIICSVLSSSVACWVLHPAVSRIMNSFTQLEVLVDMSRKLFSATLDFI